MYSDFISLTWEFPFVPITIILDHINTKTHGYTCNVDIMHFSLNFCTFSADTCGSMADYSMLVQ